MSQNPFLVKNAKENVKYGKITLLAMILIEIVMFFSTLIVPDSFGAYKGYYQGLYGVFATACLLMMFILFKLEHNVEKNTRLITILLGLFSFFIAQWAIGITILDFYHLHSLKETVLITCIFWIMIVFTFPPLMTVSLIGAVIVIYTIEIGAICKGAQGITKGSVVNLLILAMLATLVSMMRYRNAQRQFDAQMTILSKNKALEKANLEILKGKKRIEKSNIEKTQFLANMSQEFRSPINTIIESTERIRIQLGEESMKACVSEVQSAGYELLKLANEVVDFSKIDSGYLPINERRYHLRSFLQQTLDSIKRASVQKDIYFNLMLNSSFPDFLIGDDIKLGQVIHNLLSNSIQTVAKGEVILSVDGTSVENGRIDLNIQIQISSTQNETRENRSVIGLNLVQKYLELMHGSLRIQKKTDKDSMIVISLKQKISQTVQRLNGEFQAPEARILIIGENQVNMAVLKSLLKKTKMKVEIGNKGVNAIQKIEAKEYHLILLEHFMAGVEDNDLLDQIRMKISSKNKKTPVIAIVGNSMSVDWKEYMDGQFDGFLTEPVIGSALENMVLQFLPKELCHFQSPGVEKVTNRTGVQYCNLVDSKDRINRDMQEIIQLLEEFELYDAILCCKEAEEKAKGSEKEAIFKEARQFMEQVDYDKAISVLKKASHPL